MEIKVIASGSSGNAYLVSDGKTTLLLDAGVPFRKIQLGCGFQTSQIRGCLVTHRHGDHSKAVPELIRRGIPVYGPLEVAMLFDGVTFTASVEDGAGMLPREIGSFTVTAFNVAHDTECYGYWLHSEETDERLLYVTDTAYVRYTFNGITHLMIEANYAPDIIAGNLRHDAIALPLAKRVIQTHMSIETLLGLLKANDMSKVQQIYLLHLSDSNSDAAMFKKQVQQETGAEVYVF